MSHEQKDENCQLYWKRRRNVHVYVSHVNIIYDVYDSLV